MSRNSNLNNTTEIIDLTNDNALIVTQSAKKTRAPPRCGHCGVQGHTIRSCTDQASRHRLRELWQMISHAQPCETIITWLDTLDVTVLQYMTYRYTHNSYKKHSKHVCIEMLALKLYDTYAREERRYMENVQTCLYQGRILIWAWIEEPGNIPILYRQYCSRDTNNPPPTEEECDLVLSIIISQHIPRTTPHRILKRIYEFMLYRCNLFTREADATTEDNVLKYGIIRKKISTPIQIECPICMDTKETPNILTTTCGHQFCKNCITTVITKSTRERCNCPMCRTPIHKLTLDTL